MDRAESELSRFFWQIGTNAVQLVESNKCVEILQKEQGYKDSYSKPNLFKIDKIKCREETKIPPGQGISSLKTN